MKINLDNFESVKYKVTDDISIEISIINDELTINTINKQPQKDIAQERFNQLCNSNTMSVSQKNSTDLKQKIHNILETKRLEIDNNKKPVTDLTMAKVKNEFDTINEKADAYLKNKPELLSQFKHIGSLDKKTNFVSNVTIKTE